MFYCNLNPGLWPERFNLERDNVGNNLACRGAEKTDQTKMALKDMKGKPFPDYLQVAKSANRRAV